MSLRNIQRLGPRLSAQVRSGIASGLDTRMILHCEDDRGFAKNKKLTRTGLGEFFAWAEIFRLRSNVRLLTNH